MSEIRDALTELNDLTYNGNYHVDFLGHIHGQATCIIEHQDTLRYGTGADLSEAIIEAVNKAKQPTTQPGA